MGGICQKQITISEQEINKSEQARIYIKGPPKVQKPSPIENLQFQSDVVMIEKEKCISLPKMQSQEEEFTIAELEMTIKDVKIQQTEEIAFLQESDQQEQQKISNVERNSLKNETKGSNSNISKRKSILKNKIHDGSNPQSPNTQLLESQTTGSQRSLKKVTFNKKQKVVYSSFRNIKN
ncbi:unnamed protein product (macronuclear) [Paramecium tetraurelia]|uniref:Shugoshin C-terminal domain-containing protein n=1 Tax=Paramecium tetraurelia TaxID=5888 RepID=A0BIN3_PARTE|nr:uncharacterized protein GSPATT00004772001 [Paramecium tetraurelia]CAK58400.1 unnamed protein product [Paramecium tetraurelia]|eukprot:XP_001425798.1 hypothetical protein (macronuclear) [Paramecium tetraurelia strain d4-2]